MSMIRLSSRSGLRTASKSLLSYQTRSLSSLLLQTQQQLRSNRQSETQLKSSTFAATPFAFTNKFQTRRNYSVIEEDAPAEKIDYKKMKELSEDAEIDDNIVIVDVREPDEFSAGHIPNAVNLPCKSSPGALGLSPEEFEIRFGFTKPSVDKTLVFYCLGGVRSSIIEELAMTFGYNKRLNYVGSMEDWVAHEGEVVTLENEAK